MRVIAGAAGGRQLKAPATSATRPTSDLVRGALFSMLESRGADFSRTLDLYAGSGALGIEALSRGATWCDFVERDAKACRVIRQNLDAMAFSGRAAVYAMDAAQAIRRLSGEPYTLVLADPPYADEAAPRSIESIMTSALVSEATILAWERSRRQPAVESIGEFVRLAERRHGDTLILLFGRP